MKSEYDIKIRMLKTVRGGYAPPGTILREGKIYNAKSNPNGAISGFCDNGEFLGVKPGEFEFVKAPKWVLAIWRRVDMQNGKS